MTIHSSGPLLKLRNRRLNPNHEVIPLFPVAWSTIAPTNWILISSIFEHLSSNISRITLVVYSPFMVKDTSFLAMPARNCQCPLCYHRNSFLQQSYQNEYPRLGRPFGIVVVKTRKTMSQLTAKTDTWRLSVRFSALSVNRKYPF